MHNFLDFSTLEDHKISNWCVMWQNKIEDLVAFSAKQVKRRAAEKRERNISIQKNSLNQYKEQSHPHPAVQNKRRRMFIGGGK